MPGPRRVIEFFASGVWASIAMRIEVIHPAPDRCYSWKELSHLWLRQRTTEFCEPISVCSELGLSPSPPGYILPRDDDISQDRGCPQLLFYVESFMTTGSASWWVFSSSLRHELCYVGSLEAASSSFAHGARRSNAREDDAELCKASCFS
jgi:hypothetical protein